MWKPAQCSFEEVKKKNVFMMKSFRQKEVVLACFGMIEDEDVILTNGKEDRKIKLRSKVITQSKPLCQKMLFVLQKRAHTLSFHSRSH